MSKTTRSMIEEDLRKAGYLHPALRLAEACPEFPDVLQALHEAMQAHPDQTMYEVVTVCLPDAGAHIVAMSDDSYAQHLRVYAKPPSAKDRLRAALDVMDARGGVLGIQEVREAARALLDED